MSNLSERLGHRCQPSDLVRQVVRLREENELIRQIGAAVSWCQANKVSIDCTDGYWEIETWPDGENSVRSESCADFLSAVASVQQRMGNVRSLAALRVETEKKDEGPKHDGA